MFFIKKKKPIKKLPVYQNWARNRNIHLIVICLIYRFFTILKQTCLHRYIPKDVPVPDISVDVQKKKKT